MLQHTKGWIGHRAVSCGNYGLQCCVANSEVGKVNTGRSTYMSKSVPQTIGESHTLLQRQWLKRKRVKRTVGVDSNDVLRNEVDITRRTVPQRPSRQESIVCYLTDWAPAIKSAEELNFKKDLEDNLIDPVNPGASISVSVESNDCHTGFRQRYRRKN